MLRPALDWLDSRTGYRGLLRHALDEPLPPGTGWSFTTGSLITLLIGVQMATGVVLTMYYVPAPALAYDSVRYISQQLPLGGLLRGLHFWGASFVVVAAAIHMLRVFFFASYKAPREVTWLTGVVLFLLILAFSLSGYLLPWDQKAYWATTVTIGIAGSMPLVGPVMADVLRGGSELGALTLGRWYSAHVFLLPATLVLFLVSHILLMRKHGISGPVRARSGPPVAFFPWHVMKDTVVMAAGFALLVAVAATVPAPLDAVANPSDAAYVPRPEWYFLSLFQLLKYFPGHLEPVATAVIPGVVVGFLLLLPFLDRSADRRPWRRARAPWTAAMLVIVAGVVALTVLGWKDAPASEGGNKWSARALAGGLILGTEGDACSRCHVAGGPAAPLSAVRVTREDEWLLAHMADPVALAPGVRSAADPAPKAAMNRPRAQAVVTYLRRASIGDTPPALTDSERVAVRTVAEMCVGCHRLDGEGGSAGPDLSHVASRRSAADLHRIIVDPRDEYGDTMMPAFGPRLGAEQVDAVVAYLAARR